MGEGTQMHYMHVRNSQRTDILKTKIGKNKRKKKEETEMKILALFFVQVNAKQAWVTVFLVREMVMFQKIKKIKSKNEQRQKQCLLPMLADTMFCSLGAYCI